MSEYGEEAFSFTDNSIAVTIPFNRLELGDSTGEITPDTTPDTTPVTTPVDISTETSIDEKILLFCTEPRNILEIAGMLGFKEKISPQVSESAFGARKDRKNYSG